MKSSQKEVLKEIKGILKKVKESQPGMALDIEAITEKDDLRLMNMDSLDIISFRFTLDQTFNIVISDEDFEDKQLTHVGNLISYLTTKP